MLQCQKEVCRCDVTLVRLTPDAACHILTLTSWLIVKSYFGLLVIDGYNVTFYTCSLRPHIVNRIRKLSESKSKSISISRSYLFSQPTVKAKAKALLQGASGCVYTHSNCAVLKIQSLVYLALPPHDEGAAWTETGWVLYWGSRS
jgi:hypothetical protein